MSVHEQGSASVQDLRELLQTHAEQAGAVPGLLEGVHARVARDTRRRRALVSAAVAVVLLAVLSVVLPLRGGRDATLQPTTSGPSVLAPAGVEQYVGGGRLAAVGRIDSPGQTSTQLSFTPTSWELELHATCQGGVPQSTLVSWSVNGRRVSGGSCGGGLSFGIDAEKYLSSYGVRLGSPATLTATIIAGPGGVAGDIGRGTVLPAVYQQVPPQEYPLPAQPATLLALAAPSPKAVTVWDSRAAGAVSSTTRTVDVANEYEAVVNTVAPGEVEASVDGHLVGRYSSWGWSNGAGALPLGRSWLTEHGVTIPASGTVELTITARRFTVPGWTVETRTG